jgi:hypothetical protein
MGNPDKPADEIRLTFQFSRRMLPLIHNTRRRTFSFVVAAPLKTPIRIRRNASGTPTNRKEISMKKTISTTISIIGLLLPVMAQAQGTQEFSNLGQTSAGSLAVASDDWIARAIGPLSGSFNLDSIQLLMDAPSGTPGAFSVSIYDGPRIPEFLVGNLVGSNPSTAGIYTYNASGITLHGGNDYFIVVTGATPQADGAYNWSFTDTTPPAGAWSSFYYYVTSSDGQNWSTAQTQDIFQLAIFATPTPEPGTLALVGLGLGCLALLRRKQAN